MRAITSTAPSPPPPTSPTPVFESEVRFFRNWLGISYETGVRLRERRIIVPDASTPDGRALYRVNPEAIARVKQKIGAYRDQVMRSRHNL